MIADFLAVIPRTRSLVLMTFRPEYRGVLSQVDGAQTIALAPLTDPETAALVTELIGRDPSVDGAAAMIVERSAGNPFFAEEIVWELAERGVLQELPATMFRRVTSPASACPPRCRPPSPPASTGWIRRPNAASAAAVIGAKFSRDLLQTLGIEPALEELARGQFIDQVAAHANMDTPLPNSCSTTR